jgi:hypothetical protein
VKGRARRPHVTAADTATVTSHITMKKLKADD